ncbi:MAG: PTS sugar transporter subunit IIA, partial [Candidatus Omnitrophica bacterium]|nr:PTS sugar transporter subunit IIA [Candidatus Omnitrophota bacterium]
FLKTFKDKNSISVMSLALAMILAGVFEKSGLAMIIGAYIMGLSLSKTDLAFIIQENLSVVSRFLVPMFFCVMGMLVNVKEIASPSIFNFAVVFSLVAVFSKIIGCSIPALFLNFNLNGALRIGVGMIPRGEVALIMAGIGLSLGVLEHDAFTVAIIMTFLTTLITPPILSKLLDSKKPVLRKQLEPDKEHEQIVYPMPNPETAEYLLYKIVEAFENEGFYVHVMEIPEKLYQIRKNNTFITFKYTFEKMTFDCAITDAAFIHTLFYEVIAELENMMKSFAVLTNKKEVAKKIFDSKDNYKKNKFNIKHLLHPLACECNLASTDKEDVIEELVNLLIRSGQLEQGKKGEVLREIFERENNMSTGMQDGIALPHAKSSVVNRIICAIGIKKQGIKFNSLDGQPAKIFVLTVAPKKNTESYLQFMANISKALSNKESLTELINCKTNNNLYSFFA